MTVRELIEALRELPPDTLVLRSWEGELVTPRVPRLADCYRFLDSKSASEDYYPEASAEDLDYAQFRAVILE